MILRFIDFLNKSFGIGKDTAATILVTLFTFCLGILITIVFKAIEGYLDRNNYRKLFKINIVNLIEEMSRQAISYKTFADELKIEAGGVALFTQVSISSIGIFYQLGYKSLYNAFFNGFENLFFFGKKISERRASFNNLWSTLEFLMVFHQKSFNDVKEYIRSEKEANQLRNQSIDEAYQLIYKIRFTFHAEKLTKNIADYCNALEDILTNHQKQNDNSNPRIVNDYIILPMMELNNKDVDVLKEYFNELNPVALNSALWKSSITYQNHNNLINTNRGYFGHFSENFLTYIERLRKAEIILFK